MEIRFKDYLLLHSIVVILGLTAILGKLINANPLILVLYRTAIATVIIFFLMIFQKNIFMITKGQLAKLIGVGLVLALHWLCFFGSARLATVSISLVAFSTTSFFTSLIEPFVNKKKVSLREVFLGIVVLLGILLIFKFESAYYQGIILGLMGAILSAIYSTANVILIREVSSRLINFYELLVAALAMLAIVLGAIYTQYLDLANLHLTFQDAIWVLVLASVCTVLPYIALVNLMKKFNAFTVTLSVNMEPIYGIALALLFFGETEKMTTGFYGGAALILSTVVLHAYWSRQKKAPKITSSGQL
jgi:drug/metabolite transporter (DMT)-like permease